MFDNIHPTFCTRIDSISFLFIYSRLLIVFNYGSSVHTLLRLYQYISVNRKHRQSRCKISQWLQISLLSYIHSSCEKPIVVIRLSPLFYAKRMRIEPYYICICDIISYMYTTRTWSFIFLSFFLVLYLIDGNQYRFIAYCCVLCVILIVWKCLKPFPYVDSDPSYIRHIDLSICT